MSFGLDEDRTPHDVGFGYASNGGPKGIRTLDLSDANESKALICIDFQTFPALSAGM
mgnify:CR=1 FL=1